MSKAGRDAKSATQLEVFVLPKRSPDLNVLDYAVWAEMEKRMRRQEKRMPEGKRETREEFERRLDRTAQQLPRELIEKSIGDMPRRVERLYMAKGGLFEEGGNRRRAR